MELWSYLLHCLHPEVTLPILEETSHGILGTISQKHVHIISILSFLLLQMSCHPSRTCLSIRVLLQPPPLSWVLPYYCFLSSLCLHPVTTLYLSLPPILKPGCTFHLKQSSREVAWIWAPHSQRFMELEEKSAVHTCGTRKTSFRVPAGLLHGGLSVPVCMCPGSLLGSTSSAHRSSGNCLACIARVYCHSDCRSFDLCQMVNE